MYKTKGKAEDEADPQAEFDVCDGHEFGEDGDPDGGFEATTSQLRGMWANWKCKKGSGSFADIRFFGRPVGGVPVPTVDAYKALESALRATGYVPTSRWSYVCRKIDGSDGLSLHSYGIAIDIDPEQNPQGYGDKYNGKIKPHHVAAALAIKNTAGRSVWSWGGNWSRPDRMHFQIDQAPTGLEIDWETVAGGDSDRNGEGAEAATRIVQRSLQGWDPAALPKYGVDGDFGTETKEWLSRFQTAHGLDATGQVEGVSLGFLLRHEPGEVPAPV